MIGQSYSACALVKPSASVRTTRSNDSGVIGRGACILSSAQKPSISSGSRKDDFVRRGRHVDPPVLMLVRLTAPAGLASRAAEVTNSPQHVRLPDAAGSVHGAS